MAGQALALIRKKFPDKLTRLREGFYDIKDKAGNVIPFRMNADQEDFILSRHGLDIILKARQKGFTTVIQLDMLDDCLFKSNFAAGVIAHNLTDAKAFFKDKIKFAYDRLPEVFKAEVSAEQDAADSLRFSNGSSIRVGTSLRSGTLQALHVSEYGKLCAKYPDKAEEVKTGAFNTVHVGQRITVESTAEGQGGHFYELTESARKRQEQGVELTEMDFMFHFYPWHTDPGYVLDADVTVTTEMKKYFDDLEAQGVVLNDKQKAWYIKKEEQQGDKMKREYPATAKEAFEAAIEGAYLATQMSKVRKEGRICKIPILDKPVYTTWDLGVNDDMCITFWQDLGVEKRAIDYYSNSGEGFAHYAKILQDKGYVYDHHDMPHDAKQRRLGKDAKSAQQHAEEAGIKPIRVVDRIANELDGIEASRNYLAQCWFDEERCADLIKCLDNYRKEWDDKRGVWKDRPRHDEASHGYKSFETAAVASNRHNPKDFNRKIIYPKLGVA